MNLDQEKLKKTYDDIVYEISTKIFEKHVYSFLKESDNLSKKHKWRRLDDK